MVGPAVVFLPGCGTAPDMPLGLVDFQHSAHLKVQPFVILGKPLGKVLVDCGFGNAKMPGAGSHRGIVFNDIHSQFTGSLPDGICHTIPSQLFCC